MKYLIILIFIVAAILRLYNLNWDQGFHLHPDERMITMVAEKITFDDLNPRFFAYGSFPLYLLKATGTFVGYFNPEFAVYTSMNLAGRFLSALFDLGTLTILYFLAKKTLDQKIALLSSFFYAVSVLPIQLSHFYAVDTPLTFFTITTLYFLVRYMEKLNSLRLLDRKLCLFLILVAISFGLALATKTSAILLIAPIILTLVIKKKFAAFTYGSLLAICIIFIFFIFEPFAFLDFKSFWQQTIQQQEMTKSAFTFPYTLQYVGKIPFLYEIKNIFFWGMGPFLASFAFIGAVFFLYKTFHPTLNSKFIILNSFFWIYFLVTGSFTVGFMRYMLPIYPLLCLFAAIVAKKLFYFLPHTTYYLLLIPFLIWPLAFISIYSQPNTRVQATEWINQNIPAGKTLSIEHWDDGLPLLSGQNYHIFTLPLYDPDTSAKWLQINQTLSQTDYIILASNRLYAPLQKLTDCPNLPPGKCYVQTSQYYKSLFNGSLGFTKVAEFSVQPNFSLFTFHFSLDDSSADESFTVYDHPKVLIYKNLNR